MILLDTQALVWAALDPQRLSKPAAAAIEAARQGDGVGIAAVTLWEVAMLMTRGRIRADLAELVAPATILPLTVEVALTAARFPGAFPRDPMDRLIAATARVHELPLVTSDHALRASALLRTVW